MNKTVASCLLIVVGGFLLSLAIEQPTYISDNNVFLKDFIGSNLLNVLGVILAITLASSAQLHLELNKIEEKFGRRGFRKSRENIRGASVMLIALFVIACILLIIKPAGKSDMEQSFFNGAELFVLFFNILLLFELTQAAFSIKSNVDEDATSHPALLRQDQELQDLQEPPGDK